MNTNVTSEPLLFLKPASAVIFNNDSIIMPQKSQLLHHEIELGIVISKKGKNIPKDQAQNHILGYTLGLDITARDIQQEAKQHGWPWSIAKGFDTFCPLSEVILKNKINNPHNLSLTLKVNGEIRQQSNTNQMIFSVEEIIAFISNIMTLERGDLILTGTPEGVGPLQPGDVVEASLDNLLQLKVDVKAEK